MQSVTMQSTVNRLPWFCLTLIAFIYGIIGWSLFTAELPRSAVAAAAVGIFALAATSRFSAQTGFDVWGGVLALTFGTVFILIGVLISSGAYAWAFTIACVWAFGFALDLALVRTVDVMDAVGFTPRQIFWILVMISSLSVTLGWVTHKILLR
ncbi:MAG: hypothetical protein N2235_04715 [Fischerella sp.]|nr:hypothetical protein [Fischerella sp.]